MRPSKFTEEQVIRALEQARRGMKVVAVCRALGITQTTFYRWRTRHEGAARHEARLVAQLEEENRALKQMVADLMLERERALAAGGRARRRPGART